MRSESKVHFLLTPVFVPQPLLKVALSLGRDCLNLPGRHFASVYGIDQVGRLITYIRLHTAFVS